MKKLLVDELLRLACIYAEADRAEFLLSLEPCKDDPTYAQLLADTRAFITQLYEYRIRRWGKTRLATVIDTATELNVEDL